MIREIKELDTELGRRVKEIYDRGELVDDATIVELIESRLDRGDTIPGFILDGFPRNIAQAEALDELLARLGRDLDVVFELQIPDREVLIERIAKRAVEEGRTDDTPDAIRKRLEIYDRETAPLVEHYRATRGNVVGIHADRPVDEVFAEIREALEQVAPGDHPQVAAGDRADGARRRGRRRRRSRCSASTSRPGVTTAELDALAEEFIICAGRLPDLQGLPRLPGGDLPLAELDGRPRHPGLVRARRGRHPLRRRRRHARRLRRRLRVHVPGRRDLAGGRAAARGRPGGARRRDRAVPGRATASPTSRTRSSR